MGAVRSGGGRGHEGTCTPFALHAAAIASRSSSPVATGFSTSTCFPASAALTTHCPARPGRPQRAHYSKWPRKQEVHHQENNAHTHLQVQ